MSTDAAPLIDRIDHVVLTVASIEATCAFYERALGFLRINTPGRPTALGFGAQKINLHEPGHMFEPRALHSVPGSADFCLISIGPLDAVRARLAAAGVVPELGPVRRNGALGPMMSVYFRDPDQNLIEVSVYD